MSLSVCAVRSGMSAASRTTSAKTADFGTRSYRSSTRPGTPARRCARSPERATHSSAPIAGPECSGCGVCSLTSDLLRGRRAEEPRRSQEQERDENREDDDVLVRRRDVANRERTADTDREPTDHRAGDASDPAHDGCGEGYEPDLE